MLGIFFSPFIVNNGHAVIQQMMKHYGMGIFFYPYTSDFLGVWLLWFSIFPNTFYFIILFYVAIFCYLLGIPFFFLSRYTAVGVFVLGRMFREAWGTEASKKQVEFNNFLEGKL